MTLHDIVDTMGRSKLSETVNSRRTRSTRLRPHPVIATVFSVLVIASSACTSGTPGATESLSAQPITTASCPSARPTDAATGTWSRAAGVSERTGFERILAADCGIADSEPSSFAGYDQLDGARTLGLHVQTFCNPFEVAFEESDDSVQVWVRTTVVKDLNSICNGDIDARLGTYVITLDRELGDRTVLPS